MIIASATRTVEMCRRCVTRYIRSASMCQALACACIRCHACRVVADQQCVDRDFGAPGFDRTQFDRHLGRAAPRTANVLCDSFKVSMTLVHDRLHAQLVSCAPGGSDAITRRRPAQPPRVADGVTAITPACRHQTTWSTLVATRCSG